MNLSGLDLSKLVRPLRDRLLLFSAGDYCLLGILAVV